MAQFFFVSRHFYCLQVCFYLSKGIFFAYLQIIVFPKDLVVRPVFVVLKINKERNNWLTGGNIE